MDSMQRFLDTSKALKTCMAQGSILYQYVDQEIKAMYKTIKQCINYNKISHNKFLKQRNKKVNRTRGRHLSVLCRK